MGHSDHSSFGRTQKAEVAADKAAKENSYNFNKFLKLSAGWWGSLKVLDRSRVCTHLQVLFCWRFLGKDWGREENKESPPQQNTGRKPCLFLGSSFIQSKTSTCWGRSRKPCHPECPDADALPLGEEKGSLPRKEPTLPAPRRPPLQGRATQKPSAPEGGAGHCPTSNLDKGTLPWWEKQKQKSPALKDKQANLLRSGSSTDTEISYH